MFKVSSVGRAIPV